MSDLDVHLKRECYLYLMWQCVDKPFKGYKATQASIGQAESAIAQAAISSFNLCPVPLTPPSMICPLRIITGQSLIPKKKKEC